MRTICVLFTALGVCIMLYGIAKYYKSLSNLKVQINMQKLFSNWIYIVCFIMMLFFLIGYVVNLVIYAFHKTISTQDLLISFIFFLGAVFVLAMVTMTHHMLTSITDNAELKKRLQQQELVSAIYQSFTTNEDPNELIRKALKMSGEFMKVNHAFLSQYRKESEILECLYEWLDEKGTPFIGGKDKWPLTPDMQYYKDLLDKGYSAISDYRILKHLDFKTAKDNNMRASLNIPIYVSGKFWGVLGFIVYETFYNWNESNIALGKLIAGVFSGSIGRNIADEELIKAKKMAEQGSIAKSEFLSRMSHEIRTPMNTIIGMTNIGKNSQDIERKDYCFEKIESASTHLLGIINDVLDVSKFEANKLVLSFADFNLENMLARVANVISHQMEEKKQLFILSIDKNVPETINSDEQRLSQVITNLLSNAVKFTPDSGKISLFVRKLKEENGSCILQFEVKDTGIGITQEQQANLFKPFEQADGSISRKYGGTGLGLAISKQIVEMMDGEIKIESESGHGTSFIFNIRADITQPLPETSEGEDAGINEKYSKGCFKNKKILIAEDIEINREIVAALLGPSGAKIDFAENGRMAYEMFAANPSAYDAILMDVHMPEIDGYEATGMIRAIDNPRAKTVPIIAMTADVFREDIENSIASGMNAHVGKPLNIDDVIAKLAHYMSAECDE
ncbi:MAG: ATP-binding protein [Endomicrobia bacterium]|nr:ATP-binding protein [Endomicrobiia bacterium]